MTLLFKCIISPFLELANARTMSPAKSSLRNFLGKPLEDTSSPSTKIHVCCQLLTPLPPTFDVKIEFILAVQKDLKLEFAWIYTVPSPSGKKMYEAKRKPKSGSGFQSGRDRGKTGVSFENSPESVHRQSPELFLDMADLRRRRTGC
jgi:hypothetical protein